jgi:8-oxo-dGTP pyrophosphatase MutT (NUDIX family)
MTAGAKRTVVRMPVRQVAALCWRKSPRLEVLLVTSLRSHRWIIPKGWPELGLTLAESAAHEALEEAGVVGDVASTPLGKYHYVKEKKDGITLPCDVVIFALEVKLRRRTWPEKALRECIWLTPELAAARVEEPGLRQVLLNFSKRWAAA